jgi:nucleotide-binding universal stress UspA family protein
MKTVLVPIDFSPLSSPAIVEAIALARSLSARLVLLHVVRPQPLPPATFGGGELPADASAAAARQLRDLQRALLSDSVTAHAIHLVGEPGPRIVEQAARLEADFIVMGMRGHTAFYELMLGGTANHVLQRAHCPVVLLPQGSGAAVPRAPAVAVSVGDGI